MIVLPLRSERPPLVRVLAATKWGEISGVGGGGQWVPLPMLTTVHGGYELLDGLTRPVLPEIGECKLRMRYGVINGKIIGLSASAYDSIQANSAWDSSGEAIEVPTLIGKEIRVQIAPDDGAATTAWVTVWWGSCEYETDSEWPAASMPVGERICHCLDGLYRTKRWFMSRHAAYINGTRYEDSPGHPGYNVGFGGVTLGNRDTSSTAWQPYPDSDNKFIMHTWQGSETSAVWTDQQAAEHALRVGRPEGQPQFNFGGTTTLLSVGASPWPIEERDSAFDVLIRICARERGRGSVQLAFTDSGGDPSGPLEVVLQINPQVREDITYISNPTQGTTATVNGASSEGTTIDVDLIGDHRALPVGFNRSVRGIAKYDAVETVGERIQVGIVASRKDGTDISLNDRWAAGDRTDFLAQAAAKRVDERWRPVFQSYGIPRTWLGQAKDHDAGAEFAVHQVDYSCNDLGAITFSSSKHVTNPMLVRVLPDTPFYEGYVYDGANPALRGGGTQTGLPARLPPTVYFRRAANRYLKDDDLTVHIKNDEIHIAKSSDQADGVRYVGDTTVADLGSAYDTAQLGVTIGIELPHRLRFRSVATDLPASGLGRRNLKRIEVPDAHLWLASPGAIWGLDDTTGNADGFTARRGACNASLSMPGILRDDRRRVAFLHALACAWYLTDHRPASWTMRCCGLLPEFGVSAHYDNLSTPPKEVPSPDIDPSTTVSYPILGQHVHTLAANGQTTTIDAPITGIIYNHQSQTTTWSCDWVDLDVSRA